MTYRQTPWLGIQNICQMQGPSPYLVSVANQWGENWQNQDGATDVEGIVCILVHTMGKKIQPSELDA